MRDLLALVALLASPVGMGLIMLMFMGKDISSSKEKLQTGRAPSLAQLEGERARLDDEITRLDRESRQPVSITGS